MISPGAADDAAEALVWTEMYTKARGESTWRAAMFLDRKIDPRYKDYSNTNPGQGRDKGWGEKPGMTRWKGLIFDMDGLMIDSERLYFQAERELAASFGKSAPDELLRRMMGRKALESMDIFVRDLGLPLTPEGALALRNPLMRRLMREDLRPMPGLTHIMQAFSGRLKMAVATGAPREFLDIALDGLGLRDGFDLLLASDGIRRGKPDPEIFLTACSGLGLPAAACIVLEDSQSGVLAAKRAGCYVVAVPTEYSREQDFSPADVVVSDLRQAEKHISSLLSSG